MSNGMMHPDPERLEAYADGALGDADRAVLESHLAGCARCRTEIEEWRSLFATLASLPRIEPSAGFADRIMAQVPVRQPWARRAEALLRHLVPTGSGGWALVAALVSLPVLALGGAAAWLLSRPGVTPQWLWIFARERTAEAVTVLGGRLLTLVMESQATLWLIERGQLVLTTLGVREMGALAALFATATLVSSWILYENLFRTRTREDSYATFSF